MSVGILVLALTATVTSLIVEATWGQQVVDVVESQVPAALRPLLAELLRQAHAGP
jgi:hypothetical protein